MSLGVDSKIDRLSKLGLAPEVMVERWVRFEGMGRWWLEMGVGVLGLVECREWWWWWLKGVGIQSEAGVESDEVEEETSLELDETN